MSCKIKILHACRLTPIWGVDLFKEMTKAYTDDVYEITTVFLSGQPNPELLKTYHGSVLFFDLDRKSISYRVLAFFKLLQLCLKHHYDVIICHHYKPTVLVNSIAWLCRIPRLFSVHHNHGNFKRASRKWMARHLFLKRWKFITVSDQVKQDLLCANIGLTPERIITIHNSIDIKAVETQQLPKLIARHDITVPSDSFVFGTVGRLVPVKGHRYLIEAFAKSIEQFPTAYLVIIGAGTLETELKQLAAKLGIANRVIIASHLAANAFLYIKAFDIFVFPSVQEGFGLALLEAMAAQLPIIATNVGGIPEALSNVGMLIASTNTDALADALIHHHQLPTKILQELGQQCYIHLRNNFSIDHYRNKFRKILFS